MRRIYLDYAATTPVVQEAIDAMASFWAERFGNAGSVHSFGQEAQRAIDAARMRIAESFGARREEILFTASATEANNLAIRGVVDAWRGGKARAMPHLVTSVLEHESVLETCRDLERRGKASVSYIGVTPEGIIRLEELERALREETALVSVQYANNEIGTIQPILEIAQIIRDFREKSEMNNEQLFEPEGSSEPERPLQGIRFVFTGNLVSMSREEAKEKVRKLGGEISSSVSRQVNYVVIGKNPGAKLAEAEKLGIHALDEGAFRKMIE